MAELKVKITAEGAAQVQATVTRMASSIASTVGRLASIAGIAGIGATLAQVTRTGIGFNATMEQARLGIAAIQKQFNPELYRDFASAMDAAGDAVDLLKEKAKQSPASFQELVTGFQGITGAATSAGIDMRRQVDLVVLMSQALAGLGIRSEQLLQESRALITGNINEDALAARILQITKGQIDAARESGQLFEFLTGKLEAFREAGEIGQATFTTMLSNLRDGLEQASAAATLPIFEALKGQLSGLLSFDWEGLGKRIGALIALGINSIEGGTFPQYLATLIEAGFEQGAKAATAVMGRLMDWLSSPDVWRAYARAQVSSWSEILRFVAVGVGEAARLGANAMLAVGGMLQRGVAAALNAIGRQLQALLNDVVTAWNLVTKQNVAPITIGQFQFGGLDGLRAQSDQMVEDYVQAVFSRIDSVAQAARDLIGTSGPGGFGDGSATERLRAQVDALLAVTREVAAAETDPAPTQVKRQYISVVEMERHLKRQVLDLERARAMVDGDFTKTEVEKYREKVAMLRAEADSRREIIAYLRQQAELAKTPGERQQILGRVDSEEQRLGQLDRERLGMGADPASFGQTMLATLTQLQDQFGTTAQIIARGFSSTVQSAVDGVASSISGLLSLTMTWGDALRNIGSSIIQGVINAISRMFAEWIAKRTMMALKDIALSKMEALAGMGPALMASIKSYGVAALVGAAALAGVMAATGGFREGGFTGAGDPSAPAGVVHRGEYVFSAPAVQRIGVDALESLHDGRGGGGMSMGATAAPVTVAVFNDPQSFARYIRENPDARAAVVDVMNENRWRSGA